MRAGRGALSLAFDDGHVEVFDNTSGFEVVHERPPRPEPPPLGGSQAPA
jgi:hypothetical protein